MKRERSKCVTAVLACGFAAAGLLGGANALAAESGGPKMPELVVQYTANQRSLRRTYAVDIAPTRMERMEKFYHDELAMLAAMDFNQLSHEDQIDYLLLKHSCNSELHQLDLEKAQNQ